MIISCTGHRPSKIDCYNIPNQIYCYICQQTEKVLLELNPIKLITGMAIGYDQWTANIAIKLGIPFVAAVPFEGQEKKWNMLDRKRYFSLLSKASDIVYVSEPGYSAEKMQIRNQYLVDNCDMLIACFNGTPGGTANCINYAQSKKKEIILIDPRKALDNEI